MAIRRDRRWRKAEATLMRNVRNAVAKSAVIYQREAKLMLNMGASRRGANPSMPGTPPHKDTGHLGRSWQVNLSRLNEKNPRARVGSNLKYARIHEYGGRIDATRTLLTVPLTQEARNLRRRHRSLRSVPGLFLMGVRKKKGLHFTGHATMYLARRKKGRKGKKGKGEAIEKLFALKSFVHLPARPYARPAAKKARPKIKELFHARNLTGVTHFIRP